MFSLIKWTATAVITPLCILAMLTILVLLTGCDDARIEQQQFDHFCQNVKIWRQTDGKDGWPPYQSVENCGWYKK